MPILIRQARSLRERTVTGRYDPKWVEEYYDECGDDEWGRMLKSPTHEVRLHVHRHYLEQYVRRGDRVLEGARQDRKVSKQAPAGGATLNF